MFLLQAKKRRAELNPPNFMATATRWDKCKTESRSAFLVDLEAGMNDAGKLSALHSCPSLYCNRSLPTRPRSHAPAWERTALHPATLN